MDDRLRALISRANVESFDLIRRGERRELRKPTAFSMTASTLAMLREEAEKRGLSQSRTLEELIEAAHRGELDPL